MLNDPWSIRHGTWIGVSLERLAILDVVDKQKGSSIYRKREKDSQREGSCLCCQYCACNATYPFPRTSRETNPPDLFLVFVLLGRMNFSRLKYGFCRLFYIHYFIHVIFLLLFSQSCQSRGLLLSSSNGSVLQYKHTHHFLYEFIFFVPCLEHSDQRRFQPHGFSHQMKTECSVPVYAQWVFDYAWQGGWVA